MSTTNAEKLAKHIVKNGKTGIMIHTVPGSGNWLICQKMAKDKWILTLGHPLGNSIYNLGEVSERQYIHLWKELISLEFENRTKDVETAKTLKTYIKNFLKNYSNKHYYNLLNKHNGSKRNKRTTKKRK